MKTILHEEIFAATRKLTLEVLTSRHLRDVSASRVNCNAISATQS
jgi:hypothetical protein